MDREDHGPRRSHGHTPCAFANLPEECRGRVVFGMGAILFVAALLCASLIVYAARKRQQMRIQFGIPGEHGLSSSAAGGALNS